MKMRSSASRSRLRRAPEVLRLPLERRNCASSKVSAPVARDHLFVDDVVPVDQ
jgi:hypothetical protein